MALCWTGALIYKSIKPVLVNPCFIVPSSVNLQIRHAARKGYREKKSRAKKVVKETKTKVAKEVFGKNKKIMKLVKTLDLDKPEPPSDDVIIKDMFNYKKYTLSEAVLLHREYFHPEVYNKPNASVGLRIEINMVAKKKTQFLKPFRGVASIPHPFKLSHQRDILVLCEPEDADLSLKCGAKIAGGADVIKKIQEGMIQPSLFEYVIAHTSVVPKLTLIRQHLKDQMPKARLGTVTNDLESTIYKYLHGIEYSCVQMGAASDFGVIECFLGTLDMKLDHLEENFKALIADIETKKPQRAGSFITWIWCVSRPSPEEFSINLSEYLKEDMAGAGDDDDDDDADADKDEGEGINEKVAEEVAA